MLCFREVVNGSESGNGSSVEQWEQIFINSVFGLTQEKNFDVPKQIVTTDYRSP